MEYQTEYERIFDTLNKHEVAYLVVGGVAVNLYGIERSTIDLDITVRTDENNLMRLSKALSSLGYKPRQPINLIDAAKPEKREEWIKEKGAKALFFYSDERPFLTIDILIDLPFEFDEAYGRRKDFELEPIGVIPTASLNDLIASKEKSLRKIDFTDVEHLIRIRRR